MHNECTGYIFFGYKIEFICANYIVTMGYETIILSTKPCGCREELISHDTFGGFTTHSVYCDAHTREKAEQRHIAMERFKEMEEITPSKFKEYQKYVLDWEVISTTPVAKIRHLLCQGKIELSAGFLKPVKIRGRYHICKARYNEFLAWDLHNTHRVDLSAKALKRLCNFNKYYNRQYLHG